eukprot:TRINITY_DN10566_c0_g1_i1.p1 TRINITY_DN10566_c0_g1~~TRINITY_DN10566_c0_g1_i1.p1  ORF type:complete len:302 (-),score=73.15 TRINITY_DN10566_c0_g1_i1:36-881(-)
MCIRDRYMGQEDLGLVEKLAMMEGRSSKRSFVRKEAKEVTFAVGEEKPRLRRMQTDLNLQALAKEMEDTCELPKKELKDVAAATQVKPALRRFDTRAKIQLEAQKEELVDELAYQSNLLSMLQNSNKPHDGIMLAPGQKRRRPDPRRRVSLAIRNVPLMADEFNMGNYIFFKQRPGDDKNSDENTEGRPTDNATVRITNLTARVAELVDSEVTAAQVSDGSRTDRSNINRLLRQQEEIRQTFREKTLRRSGKSSPRSLQTTQSTIIGSTGRSKYSSTVRFA